MGPQGLAGLAAMHAPPAQDPADAAHRMHDAVLGQQQAARRHRALHLADHPLDVVGMDGRDRLRAAQLAPGELGIARQEFRAPGIVDHRAAGEPPIPGSDYARRIEHGPQALETACAPLGRPRPHRRPSDFSTHPMRIASQRKMHERSRYSISLYDEFIPAFPTVIASRPPQHRSRT